MNPDSGAPGYDGVQAADSADPFYYRPDHDAPTHPGRAAEAQRPFKADGLKAPWYALVGNHDVLAQGEVPPTPEIDAFATGDRLVPSSGPRGSSRRARRSTHNKRSPACSPTARRSTRPTSPPTRSAGSTGRAKPSDA